MKHRILAFSKKAFIRNVTVFASGGILAQVITFGFMPFITRLFSPEALGVLGVFMSITAVTTQIGALCYPIAIVLPKKDVDAFGIVRLSLIIGAGMSFVTCVILVLFNESLAALINIESISSYLFFIPITMFAGVLLATINQWATRKQLFKAKALALSVHSFVVNASKLVLGFISPTGIGLIVLTMLGFFIHAAILLFAVRRESNIPSSKDSSSESLTTLAKCYIDFPFYRAPEQALNAISQGLPLLMLASFFSSSIAGYFALAIAALSAPTLLIGSSVADVFYQRVNQGLHNGEKLTPMIIKTTVGLFLLGTPVYLFVVLTGPELFSFIFGSNWEQSGEYARWLAPWMLMALVNKPAVTALPVLSAQGVFLVYTIVSIVGRTLAMWLGYHLYQDALISVAFFCVASVIANIFIIGVALIKSRHLDLQKNGEK